MTSFRGSPNLFNVVFERNSSTFGGGIYFGNFSDGSTTPTLTNVVFDRNTANNGGGIYNQSNSTTATNVTFSNNTVGGAIQSAGRTSQVVVTNSILWNEQAATGNTIITNTDSGRTIVNDSLVQGGYPSSDTTNPNLDANPLFVDASSGNVRLQGFSPAINIGSNDAVNGISTDIAGVARIVGGIVDLGAYEFNLDPAQYGASHPDLIRAFGYNLEALTQHYFNAGRFEGRSPDSFNEFRYIASNRDLINAFGANGAAATEHYIRNGFNEGRSLSAFDPDQYLASHRDLLTAFGYDPARATFHYILAGVNEGRSPDSFNEFRYIASHDDLIRAFGYNAQAGTNHYLFNGFSEGRNPLIFNPSSYLASNGDLIRFVNQTFASPVDGSLGNNYASALEFATFHFIANGFGEGRSRGTFNPSAYLNRHADLRTAFGNDSETALRHYIEFGFEENRAMM